VIGVDGLGFFGTITARNVRGAQGSCGRRAGPGHQVTGWDQDEPQAASRKRHHQPQPHAGAVSTFSFRPVATCLTSRRDHRCDELSSS
jgi:hypothetical protein